MTLTEAAAILGVTPDTLRQQIANGKLKARKVGRDWSVAPAEVKRYGQEHRKGRPAMTALQTLIEAHDRYAARGSCQQLSEAVESAVLADGLDVERLAAAIGLVAGFVDLDYAADVAHQYARLAREPEPAGVVVKPRRRAR